jgi:hypothetical protein
MPSIKNTLGLVLTATIILTGCSTPGPKFTDYRATLPPPAEGMSRIWFYRNSVFFGDGMVPYIKLDGTNVVRSVPDTFYQTEVAPGLHKVSVSTETTKEVMVNVRTNEDAYVNFYILPGVLVGRVVPTVVLEPDALRSMEKLTLTK